MIVKGLVVVFTKVSIKQIFAVVSHHGEIDPYFQTAQEQHGFEQIPA